MTPAEMKRVHDAHVAAENRRDAAAAAATCHPEGFIEKGLRSAAGGRHARKARACAANTPRRPGRQSEGSPSCTISASGKAWKRAAYCRGNLRVPLETHARAPFSMKPSGWQVAAAAAASRRFSAATCASCTRFISAAS